MERWVEQSEIARLSGMIIPAYFSSRPTDEVVYHLLWMTLADCHHYVDLGNTWVVVDGDPRTARLLTGLQERVLNERGQAFHVIALPENRGKLWAVRVGMQAALRSQPTLACFVTRDGDADHAVADMPALVRACLALGDWHGHSRFIVLGARHSRHHPMGWLRGELETLLDQVTIDALVYALARQGRALDLSLCHGSTVPDLSSGYKVYGRQIAEILFDQQEPYLGCLSDHDYWHFGPETMPVVEGILAGAVLAEVQRLTWDGQPATSFGEFRHATLYGALLAWVNARLDIPSAVAAQFIDNHAPALALRTTTQGSEMLASVRQYALDKLAAHRGESQVVPLAKPLLPFL